MSVSVTLSCLEGIDRYVVFLLNWARLISQTGDWSSKRNEWPKVIQKMNDGEQWHFPCLLLHSVTYPDLSIPPFWWLNLKTNWRNHNFWSFNSSKITMVSWHHVWYGSLSFSHSYVYVTYVTGKWVMKLKPHCFSSSLNFGIYLPGSRLEWWGLHLKMGPQKTSGDSLNCINPLTLCPHASCSVVLKTLCMEPRAGQDHQHLVALPSRILLKG